MPDGPLSPADLLEKLRKPADAPAATITPEPADDDGGYEDGAPDDRGPVGHDPREVTPAPAPAAKAGEVGGRVDGGLASLFDRVNQLLGPGGGLNGGGLQGGGSDGGGPHGAGTRGGGSRPSGDPAAARSAGFSPRVPESLAETGLTAEEIERLVLKFLLSVGCASGRAAAGQVKLPFNVVDPVLRTLKHEQLLAFRGAAEVGDYQYQITDSGRDRARKYHEECSYFGAAPVAFDDYLAAMKAQSIAGEQATETDLRAAFKDLLIDPALLDRLGPAVNSGRGMFLFGEAGNGKTSIAERITAAFGTSIWIPRALSVGGEIIRLFDPGVHEAVDAAGSGALFDLSGVDQRWVRITRPTVIAGGELTMSMLEIVQNPTTKICEAPLQLKSNCGTLVIDDFGRQTMPVDVLLNRWIVPLEKRYDFLNMPSGKKIQVPFDQLIVFSTNLEPKDLVDGAFLRRIPYKIEVPDPTREAFVELFEIMCRVMKLEYRSGPVDYLVREHYEQAGRPFRCCQPRDLLSQVINFSRYKDIEPELTERSLDFAVENYFSIM